MSPRRSRSPSISECHGTALPVVMDTDGFLAAMAGFIFYCMYMTTLAGLCYVCPAV